MNTRLSEGNINRLLWELSIPAILGMLSSAIFNVVDRIFVGQINPLALTGVGITMPIQVLQMAILLLIGIGSSTLVSIKLGEGKTEEAERILFLAIKYVTIALALFAGIYLIFSDQILSMLSVSESVMPYAKPYINILIFGSIFGLPGYCLNNSLRAIGKAKVSMNIILITSIMNIVLDAVFIFGFDMGIAGAAWGTVISQTTLTIFVIYYFLKAKNIPIRLKFSKPIDEWPLMKQILKNGSPSFYVQVLATFVNIFINWSFLHYGTDLDIASVTIMSTIFSFYHMVVFGIVQGNQPICGYNWGAKQYDRVAKSLKLSLMYAFGLSSILFLVILISPKFIASMFSDDPVLIDMTAKTMRIYLSMLPLVGLQTISSQFFQSVGKPRLSSILSFLRYGVILVPSVLILAPVFGVGGIYLSNAVSDFIASAIAIGFIVIELKNISRMKNGILIKEEKANLD